MLTTHCLRAQVLDAIGTQDSNLLIEEYRSCRDANDQLNTTIEYQRWFWIAQERTEELRHTSEN